MINEHMYELGAAPNKIRETFAYGLERKAIVGPENVYDLSIGNPSVPSPAIIDETIARMAQESKGTMHAYTPSPGLEDVRQTIAENLNRRFNQSYSAADLYLTSGASSSIAITFKGLVQPGEEVITNVPYFTEYKTWTENVGATLVEVLTRTDDFQMDIPALERAINPKTAAIIINSPNNPSGVVYTKETLEKIGAFLKEKEAEYGHPIYIVADEPYRELVYGDAKVTFIPEVYDNTIVCYSWSKSLSLPGERIGYVYVPAKCEDGKAVYAAVAGAAREIGSVCPPTLIQRVVQECVGCMPDLVAYDENRNDLYNGLTEMGYECAKPDGAFYLFMKAPNGDDFAFSEAAKLEENILIVPGSGFQCPGYLRLSYCVSNEMIKNSMPGFKRLIEKYGK